MIDDYPKAMALVHKMEEQLPIPVQATEELIRSTRRQGKALFRRGQPLEIKSVLYGGDEGGIMCALSPPSDSVAVVCSLTHLIVEPGHSLAAEIHAYQEERSRKLSGTWKWHKPARYTLKPRKKRRR